MKNIHRILIVNPFGIGDVLFTTPLITAMKERLPGVSISFIGNAKTVPFMSRDPRIDKVFCYERDEYVAVYRRSPWQFLLKWNRLINDIRVQDFDIAFDLSLGPTWGPVLVLAGIPVRIGYDYKGRGRWLTRKVPFKGYEKKPVAEYYLDLLEHWAMSTGHSSGQSGPVPSAKCQVPKLWPMDLFIPDSDTSWAEAFLKANRLEAGRFIAIYPGGGASWGKDARNKRWAPENYAKLADKIIENASLAVILMGDQNEKELCEKVKDAMQLPALNAAGATTITQAAALAKRSRLVIANDGGPLHVAVAAGARTVSIFGPVDEHIYGPFPRAGHVVVAKDVPCRPCYRNFRTSDCQHLSCLRKLTVEEVYGRVVACLDEERKKLQ